MFQPNSTTSVHYCVLITQKLSGGEGGDWREAWGITCYLVKCATTGWQCETSTYVEEGKQGDAEQRVLKVHIFIQ